MIKTLKDITIFGQYTGRSSYVETKILKAEAVKRYKLFEKKFKLTNSEYWLGRMDDIREFNNLPRRI